MQLGDDPCATPAVNDLLSLTSRLGWVEIDTVLVMTIKLLQQGQSSDTQTKKLCMLKEQSSPSRNWLADQRRELLSAHGPALMEAHLCMRFAVSNRPVTHTGGVFGLAALVLEGQNPPS